MRRDGQADGQLGPGIVEPQNHSRNVRRTIFVARREKGTRADHRVYHLHAGSHPRTRNPVSMHRCTLSDTNASEVTGRDFSPYLQGCIGHELHEGNGNGQAYELTRTGENVDNAAANRRANKTLIELCAHFLQLGRGRIPPGLSLSDILLARSRPQQSELRFRLAQLRSENSCITQGFEDARRRNADYILTLFLSCTLN